MRICLLLSLAGALTAQEASDLFAKAPPDVDEKTRAQVLEFYNLVAQKKFRPSEKLVCEDSRDIWYEMAKPSVKTAEIVRMKYDDQFRKVTVTTSIDGEMLTPHGALPTKYVTTTNWRMEGANWCLHIPPPPKEVLTPWGTMKTSDGTTKPAGPPSLTAGVPPPGGDPQAWMKQMAREIIQQVKFSRTDMTLKGHAASQDEIEIRNGTPGNLELSFLAPPRPGLSVSLEPKKLEPGQSAKLLLKYLPPDPNPKTFYEFTVTVEPYQVPQKIRVIFDVPDSVKQKIPATARKNP